MRREWRSFTSDEKMEYVAAVKCLATIPSSIGLNGTLYDDFSWLHRNIGQYCELSPQMVHGEISANRTTVAHGASSFLPFHRYVLHNYEKMLRERCRFTGSIP